MSFNLQQEFAGKKTFLAVVPSEVYPKTVMDLSVQLTQTFNRVAYVSLNKLISPLKRSLEANQVDTKKIFFVDGITKSAISNPPQIENCVYVPAPEDLTKLSISITKVLQTYDPDCLFFDSLSTLLVYTETGTISQFVHAIVNKIDAYGIQALFTCLKGQKEEQLIRDLTLILDKVIEQG